MRLGISSSGMARHRTELKKQFNNKVADLQHQEKWETDPGKRAAISAEIVRVRNSYQEQLKATRWILY